MADETAEPTQEPTQEPMLDGKPFRMRFPHLGSVGADTGDEIPWTAEDEAASDAAWDAIAAQKQPPATPTEPDGK